MNNHQKMLKACVTEGYTVLKNGDVISPSGEKIKPYKWGKSIKYLKIRYKNKNIVKLITEVAIHRLQAYKKFGDKIFEKGIVVRHLNGNSLDNSWDNIVIGTQSDNMFDRSKESLKEHSLIATRKRQDKFRTYKERCLIYEDLRNNIPYSEIMKTYNIPSKGTLSYMKNKSLEYKEYMEMLAQ